MTELKFVTIKCTNMTYLYDLVATHVGTEGRLFVSVESLQLNLLHFVTAQGKHTRLTHEGEHQSVVELRVH